MRLPLLVNASPSLQRGPKVLLRKGVWKLDTNARDTEFIVSIYNAHTEEKVNEIERGKELEIGSLFYAIALLIKPGTEHSISIDLVRIRD